MQTMQYFWGVSSIRWWHAGRVAGTGEFVPIAPANCCKVCLSERVHRMDTCTDLSFCHGRGVCVLGQCECFEGWAGADCAGRAASGDGDMPGWAIALIVLAGVILLILILAGAARIVRHYQAMHPGASPAAFCCKTA